MELNVVYNEDCLQGLKKLPDECVDCCITSPPYYGLRDYGTGHWEGGDPDCPHYRTNKVNSNNATGHKAMAEGGHAVGDAIYKSVCPLCGAVRVDEQIGLEETPEQYIEKLTEVFMEVHRVLKPDGTLWLNIGDSYMSGGGASRHFGYQDPKYKNGRAGNFIEPTAFKHPYIKPKDLIGIPWMLAFSLRKAGWYLRQDIIWHKPNPMPESVRDRCTKSHEYIFLLSKSDRYYFDYEAIQEEAKTQECGSIRFGGNKYGDNDDKHFQTYSGKEWKPKTKNCQYDGQRPNTMHMRREEGFNDKEYVVRNKRDVWSVNLKPDPVAHFATYPEELIRPCVLAGCRLGGVILDPFMGSGTTARVARTWGRNFVGFELNPEYIDIIKKKIQVMTDMFA